MSVTTVRNSRIRDKVTATEMAAETAAIIVRA
jgi:hypothetical protein